MPCGARLSRRIRFGALLAVCAIVASSCLVPATFARHTFVLESDVVYGQGEIGSGGTFTDLRLDLYIPQVAQPQRLPLMVMIHGGGFVSGSKTNSGLVAQAEAYAERGWLVASIDYRLLGQGPVPSARMQPMIDAGASTVGDPQLANAAIAAVDDRRGLQEGTSPPSAVVRGTVIGPDPPRWIAIAVDGRIVGISPVHDRRTAEKVEQLDLDIDRSAIDQFTFIIPSPLLSESGYEIRIAALATVDGGVVATELMAAN